MIRRGAIAVCLAVTVAMAVAGGASAHGVGGLIPDVVGATHPVHGPMAHASALDYGGGPVLHSNRTHIVFWAAPGLSYDNGYEQLVERFLTQVATDSHHASNVYGLSGQYRDSRGPAAYDSTYQGAVVDTNPLPPNQCAEPPLTGPGWTVCLTDAQLQQQLQDVVNADHLPNGQNDIYFLVLPNGLGTCIDSTSSACALGGGSTGYCGYHSQTGTGLLYAVIPYNAVPGHCQSDKPRPNGNPADPALSTLSHEHNETVTDPETYSAWVDPSGQEDGDLCITDFGPPIGGSGLATYNESIAGGHYFLQEEWSNEDGGCAPRDETDPVWFAAPGHLSAARAVSITGHASDSDGRIVAWAWHFGDGTSAHARVTSHTYRHAGVYRILLRVADSAGNWSTYQHTVRVGAPAHHGGSHHKR